MKSNNLHEMIADLYGVQTTTRINPLVDEVGVAATQVLAGDPKRLGIIIMNLSAVPMYFTPDNHPAADRGIYLAPNGGSLSMTWDRDFETVTLPWYGLATAANSDVFVMEVKSI